MIVGNYRENVRLILGNGIVLWGEVMWMEPTERKEGGGTAEKMEKKRGHNIKMADWDLVS